MKTVLLDLHGSVSRFRPATMFYYPLLQSGELFIFPSIQQGSGKLGLGAQAERIISLCKREGLSSGEWQAIVITDNEVCKQTLNPFGGSLNDSVDRLNKELFEPLRQNGRTPVNTYLVNIEKRNTLDFARVKKIDLDGYLSEGVWEGDGAVFDESDFKRIEKSWDIKIDLTGWMQGNAFPPELQDKLEAGCEQLLAELTDLVDQKRQKIQLNTPDISRFYDLNLLNKVEEEFLKSIEYRKAHPHSFVSFKPATLLQSILKNFYSIASINENHFCCINYIASDWILEETSHDTKKRLEMLRFTYFLICLMKNGGELGLKGDDCWQVSRINLDETELQGALMNCYHRWTAKIEELEDEHDGNISAEATLRMSMCECMAQTDLSDIETTIDNHLNIGTSRLKELHPFKKWEKRGSKILHQYREKLEDHWAECLDEIRMNRKSSIVYHVNAQEQIKNYQAEKTRIQKLISGLKYVRLHISWPNSFQSNLNNIYDLLFSFPRIPVFALVIGMTSLAFLIPFLVDVNGDLGLTKVHRGTLLSSITIYLGACCCAGVFYWLYRRRTVNTLILEGQTLIRQEFTDLRASERNNQKYMSTICQLGNVVRNQAILRKSYNNGKVQRRKKKYFQNTLREHIDWLRKFTTIQKGIVPGLLPHIPLLFDLPPELNENFCPTCGNNTTSADIEVQLGTVVKTLQNHYCPGLKEIQMDVVTSSDVLAE